MRPLNRKMMSGVINRHDHRAGGFTLLEMIICLAIIIIILTFSVGWVVNRDGQKVEVAYSELDAALRYARGGAMEAQGPWVITFSANGMLAEPAKSGGNNERFQKRVLSWDDGTVMEILDEQMGGFRVPEEPIRLVISHRAFLPAIQLRVRNGGGWISGKIDPVSGALIMTDADY